MDPQEVARQLTLIEHRLYAKVRVQECWEWGRTGGMLHDFTSTHDKLASWAKMSILNLPHVAKRAELVDFWINCAEVRRHFLCGSRLRSNEGFVGRNAE
jgi:son of sevenless-like protein